MSHPLCPEVGVLGLLLAGVGAVHGVVLLQLHRLHLLLDGVHCGVCVIERRGKEAENRTRVRNWETSQVSLAAKWVGKIFVNIL